MPQDHNPIDVDSSESSSIEFEDESQVSKLIEKLNQYYRRIFDTSISTLAIEDMIRRVS